MSQDREQATGKIANDASSIAYHVFVSWIYCGFYGKILPQTSVFGVLKWKLRFVIDDEWRVSFTFLSYE
jgi:hypothetical protein